MENRIDITGVDLVVFVKKVYELSVPQGLGMLHFKEGRLSDEEAKEIVGRGYISMDYVHGRACKMKVFKKDEKLYIPDRWYDHTDYQLNELLETVMPGVKNYNLKNEHSPACNCRD